MSELTFATISGVTLHYTLDGLPAGVPLVFLNSLGTDLRIWDRVIPHLANRYRLIRYDKRGHGLSDSPPGPYTIRSHADDLAGLLAYLQVDEVILLGVSVGGMIAVDYAASRPQQVKALVLCGAEDGATPPELVRGLAEALPNARFEVMEQAGHIPSLEQPAMLAAKIDQFLSENGYV